MERMGKTLFFRSGDHPLILSEEERDRRKEGSKLLYFFKDGFTVHYCPCITVSLQLDLSRFEFLQEPASLSKTLFLHCHIAATSQSRTPMTSTVAMEAAVTTPHARRSTTSAPSAWTEHVTRCCVHVIT